MLRQRLIPRFPSVFHLRPFRPPSQLTPVPRPFTQNSQLLLLAHRPPRPQIPYLAQPSHLRAAQSSRLISTETRAYVKDLSIQSVKWTGIIWVFVVLSGVIWMGVQMETDERKNPTPSEWKLLTRDALRSARRHLTAVEEMKSPMLDWAAIGSYAMVALKRLEDLDGDGKGLMRQGGQGNEGLTIADVGQAGFDVSEKSYEWKSGYFDVLMLCAQSAEHLENFVRDTKREKVFPREVMIGPSNPDPRPTPIYMDTAPREEDCVKFYPDPETFYLKALTTKGFSTRQKLTAAEGYANWLEFKGLNESAEEMYRWAIDIAKAGTPNPSAADSVLDPRTSVLKANASTANITPNILRAATSLATHHARTGNTSAALPILLSVLRARRDTPLARFPKGLEGEGPPGPSTDIGVAVAMVKSWFATTSFPPPGPSGDEPLVKYDSKPTCEEGELMVYIGEIIFASAPERAREGVGWTRQGVLVAEANLQGQNQSNGQDAESEKESRRCKECLLTGVQNWELMLQRLAASQAGSAEREGGRDSGLLEWRGWFGRGDDGIKGKTLDELEGGMLEEELKQVGRLRERIVREGIESRLVKRGGGMWFGFS